MKANLVIRNRKLIRQTTIPALLFFALLEIGLHIIDPLGIMAYRADLRQMSEVLTPDDERQYRLPDGEYTFRGTNWSVTVADGWRIVPDTDAAPCRIAFIGDSFTFGSGVNDDETYPNQLARQFPDVEILIRAQHGYNINVIEGVMQRTDADGYVYLGNWLDAVATGDRITRVGLRPWLWQSATLTYIRYYQRGFLARSASPLEHLAYVEALERMQDAAPLVIASDAALPVEYVFIPYRQDLVISRADGHYSAAGNRYVAQALVDDVREMVDEVC